MEETKEMVATVNVQQTVGGSDGSPASYNNVTASTRLQTKDQFAPADTSYPISIPSSDFNYSYWIHVCLDLSGTFTQINNVRFCSDGAIGWNFGTGGELRRGNRDSGDHGCAMPSEYEVATGTEADTGDSIEDATNGHSYYNSQTTPTADVASDTEGSPAIIDSTDHTSAEKTKAVVLQCKVANDAVQGEQADETLSFKYDEI
ncbi:MAG: hypothetical protein NWF06_10640 [Candidatus Bathyarchaeota archaeon]|nr:hypothetical protein [Candidatus Bathyarchaeum sp.]